MSLRHMEDHDMLERLQLEFAGMCNQIISADSLSVREKEDLAAVVKKACGYLDIGLQELNGSDPDKGARVIRQYTLNQIFRVGYGAGLKLKWKTERWFKDSWFVNEGLGPAFWGEPWGGMLEGLLRKRPLYYAGLSEAVLHREFKDLDEITQTHEAVDQMMAMDHVLSLVLTHDFLASPIETDQPLDFKNLLLTCWARNQLALSEKVRPLSVGELKAFFRSLFGTGAKPRRVEERLRQAFWNWLIVRSGLAAADIRDQVGTVLDRLFGELENEYGFVSIEDLDPRYVRHLLVAS